MSCLCVTLSECFSACIIAWANSKAIDLVLALELISRIKKCARFQELVVFSLVETCIEIVN